MLCETGKVMDAVSRIKFTVNVLTVQQMSADDNAAKDLL